MANKDIIKTRKKNDNLNAQINGLKEREEIIKSRIKELKSLAKRLMSEIREINSKAIILAPDEVKILEKLNEAVNIWDYEVVRKNQNTLLYKKRELENINSMIKNTEEMLI